MPVYPFDERNAADYQKITENIEAALQTLESHPEIPATEESLAKLAQCTRGTLRHRVYPIQRLRAIKAKRKQAKIDKGQADLPKPRTTEEIFEEEIRELKRRLDDSRSEIAVWVEADQEKKVELAKERRAKQLLITENRTLKEENKVLKDRVTELEAALRQRRSQKVVLPFRKKDASSKKKGGGHGKR